MTKILLLAFCLAAQAPLHAFDLPSVTLETLPDAAVQPPAARPAAPASYAAYQVAGTEVIVPSISCGYNVLAVLKPGEQEAALAARLREAFGAPASARLAAVQPQSKAELELAAANPGARLVSLNAFLPPNAALLFNREPNFGGPNCFNAAFMASGIMDPARKRHVGNPEADQLLAMYFKKVPAASPRPGDVLVLNGGDHAVYYLGGGLVFHKKSYLKQHIYRIARLEKAYYREPFEWTPGPFDSGSPFAQDDEIDSKEAWRPTGASYSFGQASAEETEKVNIILYLTEQIENQAPRWALSRELGYFTENLADNLASDWSAMAKSPNPVLRAYYRRLESFRDQANQSIETELLSSPHAQANAYEILKGVWLPRNAYSREIVGRLLKLYGKDPALTDRTLDAIGAKFEGSPLQQIKAAN